MKLMFTATLILILALGLSVGTLVIRLRRGLMKNVTHYLLAGLLGMAVSAIFTVLIIVAVWPPFNAVSLILTCGFVILVLCVLYFVRSTNTADETAEEALFTERTTEYRFAPKP